MTLRQERLIPLIMAAFPQRSRSQERPSGAASAGLPLDGGESEGNLKHVHVHFCETATNQLVSKKTL